MISRRRNATRMSDPDDASDSASLRSTGSWQRTENSGEKQARGADGRDSRKGGRGGRRGGDTGTVRARSMQMREYIYLGTTPMYFLGASGRIVGSELNTPRHPPRHSCLPGPTHTYGNTHTRARRRHAGAHAHAAACARQSTCQSDTLEIYEQTSRVPRANRPASYGAIQFNFENKQPPTIRRRRSIYSEVSRAHRDALSPRLDLPASAFRFGGNFAGQTRSERNPLSDRIRRDDRSISRAIKRRRNPRGTIRSM